MYEIQTGIFSRGVSLRKSKPTQLWHHHSFAATLKTL